VLQKIEDVLCVEGPAGQSEERSYLRRSRCLSAETESSGSEYSRDNEDTSVRARSAALRSVERVLDNLKG